MVLVPFVLASKLMAGGWKEPILHAGRASWQLFALQRGFKEPSDKPVW